MSSIRRLFLESRQAPISMDIELFIRLIEWAHEDAQSDEELHKMTENVEMLVKNHGALTMDHYDSIVSIAPDPNDPTS